MSTRPRVSAAFHEELSEYSSLLRALRTSNTLDLASHLTAPPPHIPACHDDDGESERFRDESVTSSNQTGSKRRRTREKDDGWTRWPLLAGDVHVPEWTLEDEVKLLALRALQRERRHEYDADETVDDQGGQAESVDGDGASSSREANDVDAVPDAEKDDDLDQDTELPAHYLTALTKTVGHQLAHILALLDVHTPPRESSMQNRLRPIGWQTVLDVAAVHGLLSQE